MNAEMTTAACEFCHDTKKVESSPKCRECGGIPHSTDGRRVCGRWLAALRAGRTVIVGVCIEARETILVPCPWC